VETFHKLLRKYNCGIIILEKFEAEDRVFVDKTTREGIGLGGLCSDGHDNSTTVNQSYKYLMPKCKRAYMMK